MVKTGDVALDCTYQIQNGLFRVLDAFIIPFILDPREAYGGIEDCALKLAAEQ